MARCSAEHSYYVADVAVVPAEGKVMVIAICRGCGKVIGEDVFVTTPENQFHLEQKEKKEDVSI